MKARNIDEFVKRECMLFVSEYAGTYVYFCTADGYLYIVDTDGETALNINEIKPGGPLYKETMADIISVYVG